MKFDEMLAQALKESFEERVEQSLSSEDEHKFSLSYRIWERKTLRDLSKGRFDSRWTLSKVRRSVKMVIVAAALVLTLTACAAVGLTIGRFSFNDKREYSELFLKNLSSDKTRFEEYYGLPEEDGWIITSIDKLSTEIAICYNRQDNKVVMFSQNIIDSNMWVVNTENAVTEPMTLYKENDGFLIAFQNGDCGLYWIYDGYMFNLSGNLDKNELLNLAYSTKIIEF